MADNLNPIPVPFSQKAKQFRHRAVPILVFLIVAFFVFYLWDMRVRTPGFTGKVVADSALVTSPYDGKLDQFFLQSFDRVEQGDPIATIIRADSGYFQARLSLINSQIEQVETGMEPMLNHQRNILDYENLKLDNIENRIDLASLRLREQQRRAEYERAKSIFGKNGISKEEFEQVETGYLILKSEVEQKTELAENLSKRLGEIENYMSAGNTRTPLVAAIEVFEKELNVVEEELKPITIYAPMGGVISKKFKGNGEFVEIGDRLLEIEATEPSYIIGYVRQPFDIEPEEGMEVQVRTRKPTRNFFESYIVRVGGHIESIEPGLARPGIDQESGLPVQIAIRNDESLKLYPGEIVDVVLIP